MEIGTKSVLFGVHQFLWHPITVALAWRKLYGTPTFKILVCIFIHDLGYIGKPNMDGSEGETHPIWGAMWAHKHLDTYKIYSPEGKSQSFYEMCLYHSRTCAKKHNAEPSRLCWADKLCIKYDPWWFYLLRARLSGELFEYHGDAIKSGLLPANSTHKEWFMWARERGIRVALTENAATAYEFENPQQNPNLF